MGAVRPRFAALLPLFLAAMGLLAGCRTSQLEQPAPPTADSSLAAILNEARRRHRIPAMAAVATRADGILETATEGIRREGLPDPVIPGSRFHIGSNTKAMTATVVAKAIEEGKLSWDTTPLAVFPEWEGRIREEYRSITITDLLTHHAGLSAYDDTESPEFSELDSLPDDPVEQRREFALRALGREPAVAPRTKRLYSNGGFSIAAAMTERVTGESWESLMLSRLFDPLGIEATFEWPAFDDDRQPWGHFESPEENHPHDPHDDFQLPPFLLPAGGVSIAPTDYAKVLQLHLDGLAGKDGLLLARSIEHLHTPSSDHTAMGWGIQEFEGAVASVHTGSAGTFFAVVTVWPSRDLAVAVFANAGGDRAQKACVEVLKAMAHRY